MNFTKKGKACLNLYIEKLKELRYLVEKTKPLNEFLLDQIDSLKNILSKLVNAWDFSFEIELVKNASELLGNYNVVNGGDGSWAVALSDDNSRKLAELTKALFEDFKNNLFDYVQGLPKDGKKITFGGFTLAYSNPAAIIESAINQIQGAIQFYDYLATETLLRQNQTNALMEIPENFNQSPMTNKQISNLIEKVCQIPSSYLRKSENCDDNNVVKIMMNSMTGALGYHCQQALNYYLESYALAVKHEEPFVLTNCIQSGNLLSTVVNKLKEFIAFAEKFSKENHAEYKINIVTNLSEIIAGQLKVLATQERLNCFYTDKYCAMYIASQKLDYYAGKNQDEKITKQIEIATDAIRKYLDELKQYLSSKQIDQLELSFTKLINLKKISQSDISWFISTVIDRDIIREKLAITPTMVIHQLLKEVAKSNLDHVEKVKHSMHSLGETGDRINDLYSFLLSSFSQFTMAEEPYTLIKFKQIDNLIKAMQEELSPIVKISTNIIAIQSSGGSPLHQRRNSVEINPLPEEKFASSILPQKK